LDREIVGKFVEAMRVNGQHEATTACESQGWRANTVPSEACMTALPVIHHSLANTLNHGEHLASKALKEQFLECIGVRANHAVLLRSVVRELIDEGVPRRTLVAWAVEAGYSKGYVTSLLCRILVSLGVRKRKQGGGRKPSLAALELLAHVRSRYGGDCLKVLRAALRAGKALSAAATAQVHPVATPQALLWVHNKTGSQFDCAKQ
jgi:hypothetical protein